MAAWNATQYIWALDGDKGSPQLLYSYSADNFIVSRHSVEYVTVDLDAYLIECLIRSHIEATT